MLTRRSFCLALATSGLLASAARPAHSSGFQIYYPDRSFGPPHLLGYVPAPIDDVAHALNILERAPSTNPYDIMQWFADLPDKSTDGTPFNERWNDFANPMLRKIFSDIGHPLSPAAGDCTPWCAATLAWSLQRSGRPIPRNAPSALSFKDYGKAVSAPSPGDIVVFQNRHSHGHGHVTLFVDQLPSDNRHIRCLGANQANIDAKTTTCGTDYPNNRINITTFDVDGPALKVIAYRSWK